MYFIFKKPNEEKNPHFGVVEGEYKTNALFSRVGQQKKSRVVIFGVPTSENNGLAFHSSVSKTVMGKDN
jgi:hypothetical protein